MLPNGFTIFNIEIKFYGLIIALGFLIGIILVTYFAKKKGLPKDIGYDLVLAVFPLSIIGARVYYILFSGRSWTFAEMIDLPSGGLAIYGGIIGGFLGVLLYSKIKKIKLIELTDIAAPVLILGQALGRWGNFFNQEAYGTVVTNPSLQWFPYAVWIEAENAWHMATFFYESMWNFIGFAILLYLILKMDKKGYVTALYFIFYGIGRAVIEGFRTDSLYIANTTLRVSQVLSVILVIVGIILFIYF